MSTYQRIPSALPGGEAWKKEKAYIDAAHAYLDGVTRAQREVQAGRTRGKIADAGGRVDAASCTYRPEVQAALESFKLPGGVSQMPNAPVAHLNEKGLDASYAWFREATAKRFRGEFEDYPHYPWLRVSIDNHTLLTKSHVDPAGADRLDEDAADGRERHKKEEVLSFGLPSMHDDTSFMIGALGLGAETAVLVAAILACGVLSFLRKAGHALYILVDYAAHQLIIGPTGAECCPFCGMVEADIKRAGSSLQELDEEIPWPPNMRIAREHLSNASPRFPDGAVRVLPGLLHTICTIFNRYLLGIPDAQKEVLKPVLDGAGVKWPSGSPNSGVKIEDIDTLTAPGSRGRANLIAAGVPAQFLQDLYDLRHIRVAPSEVQTVTDRLHGYVGGSWTMGCHVMSHLGQLVVRLFGPRSTLAPLLEQSAERANQRVKPFVKQMASSLSDAIGLSNTMVRLAAEGITRDTKPPPCPMKGGSGGVV